MNGLVVFIFVLLFVYFSNKYFGSGKHTAAKKSLSGAGLQVRASEYHTLVRDKAAMPINHRELRPLDDAICSETICCALQLLKRESAFVSLHDTYTSTDKVNKPSVGLFVSSTACFSRTLDILGVTQQDFLDEQCPRGLVIFNSAASSLSSKSNSSSPERLTALVERLVGDIISYIEKKPCLDHEYQAIKEPLDRIKATEARYLLYPLSEKTANNTMHPLTRALHALGFRRVSFVFDQNSDNLSSGSRNKCWEAKNRYYCSSNRLLYNGKVLSGTAEKTIFFKKTLAVESIQKEK